MRTSHNYVVNYYSGTKEDHGEPAAIFFRAGVIGGPVVGRPEHRAQIQRRLGVFATQWPKPLIQRGSDLADQAMMHVRPDDG